MKTSIVFCFAGFILLAGSAKVRDSPFQVEMSTSGEYNVNVNGLTWLPSGSTWFNNDGQRYSTDDGTLKLQGDKLSTGKDKIGEWLTSTFTYKAGTLTVEASIKQYTNPSLPLAIFSQRYLNAANRTKGKDADDVISSFPSFNIESQMQFELGYVAYGKMMSGWTRLLVGEWIADKVKIKTGIEGGPIILFDKDSNAMVISPFSKFMAASNAKHTAHLHTQMSWGIMGLVDEVYENYSMDFIVYFSDKGINEAMRGWGKLMTTYYDKTNKFRENDLTLTHLGYWTDNGAYYYYNPEVGKNYEDTLLDAVSYMKSLHIPIKTLQIDMFFYAKGHANGTKTWVPEKDLFPHGFAYLYEKTGLPITAHNKYWDNDTAYASFNGGKYNFISDSKTGYALPVDKTFWADFLNTTRAWGKFIMYEQDFLNKQFENTNALLTDLDLGRDWLLQLGHGAEVADITVQFCMSLTRHILQSLEIPRVTQARASSDYLTKDFQWKIGFTSMFTDALNISPSKDNFWTTVYQPGSRYSVNETKPFLEVMVATLSTGPVGIGDGIGYTNVSLLMKCCDSDGKILRASRPLTVMDKSVKQAVFGNPNPQGQDEVLYSTVSNISQTLFGIILASDVNGSYALQPSDLTPEYNHQITYIYNDVPDSSGNYKFSEWSSDSPLNVDEKGCGGNSWCVFYSTPVFGDTNGNGIGLLGELGSKFSPVSPQRFSNLDSDAKGIMKVKAALNPGEAIDVWFLAVIDAKPTPVKVTCDNTKGQAKVEASASADTSGKCDCKV